MTGVASRGTKARAVGNIILFFSLAAAVLLEGYYIFSLRDVIEKRTDELKYISIELQSLKNERADLHEKLSSLNTRKGENKDGNTPERQH